MYFFCKRRTLNVIPISLLSACARKLYHNHYATSRLSHTDSFQIQARAVKSKPHTVHIIHLSSLYSLTHSPCHTIISTIPIILSGRRARPSDQLNGVKVRSSPSPQQLPRRRPSSILTARTRNARGVTDPLFPHNNKSEAQYRRIKSAKYWRTRKAIQAESYESQAPI